MARPNGRGSARAFATLRAPGAGAALVLLAAEALGAGAPLAGTVLDGPDGAVAIDDYRGRWTYVDFFASWCAPCRASFPFMDALVARHAEEGLAVLAIGLDEDPADARAFAEALSPSFDVAFDPSGASAEAVGLVAMPSSYLLAPDGTVAWSHAGFRGSDAEAIAATVAEALGGAGLADADGEGR